MTGVIRSGALAHFDAAARHLALTPAALLRQAGVDPAVLQEPEAKLPAAAVAALLEAAAAQSGRPDFGLLMAQSWTLADYGPVSLAVAHQDSLREALGALTRRRAHLSDAIAVDILEDGHTAQLRISLDLPPEAPRAQLLEFVVGKTLSLCRAFLGPGWLPTGVRFSHPEPSDPAAHRRLLGGRQPEFAAAVDAVLLRRADLDLKAPRMLDPALRRHAEALLDHLPSSRNESIAERAARVIRSRLPDGSADLANVARSLGLNGRTFQRRLQAEGLGFSDLLDQVRAETAKSYLLDGGTPLHQVAGRLGYADGSAFTRWFTHRFGEPPSRWREAARNDFARISECRSA
jgi:AraC-like DNA-binding protein